MLDGFVQSFVLFCKFVLVGLELLVLKVTVQIVGPLFIELLRTLEIAFLIEGSSLVGYSVVDNAQVSFLLHHRFLLCSVADTGDHPQKLAPSWTGVLDLSLEGHSLELFQVYFKFLKFFRRLDVVFKRNSGVFGGIGNDFL